LNGCCERVFGFHELLFSTQWAEFLRSLCWVGDLFRNAKLSETKQNKTKNSFSPNQGSVLKFGNFAVIRRMNDFSASLGSSGCPGSKGILHPSYLSGHS
jgi:hypothetical protein